MDEARILTATIDCIERLGWDAATPEQIAAACGLGSGGLPPHDRLLARRPSCSEAHG